MLSVRFFQSTVVNFSGELKPGHPPGADNAQRLPSGDKGSLLFRSLVLIVKKTVLSFERKKVDKNGPKFQELKINSLLELKINSHCGVGSDCPKEKGCQKKKHAVAYPMVGLMLWSKWSWTNRHTMLDFPTPVS